MAVEADKVRAFVEDLLQDDKALTEREVKAAIGKAFKVSPRKVGAAVIRDVRKKLGIDRPGAIAFARSMLSKDSSIEARKVMDAVSERFGVRLGAPDISRLRPRKAKTGRKPRARAAAPPEKRRKAEASAPAAAPLSALVGQLRVRKGRGRKGGAGITVTFQGSGSPDELAAFFLRLGRG